MQAITLNLSLVRGKTEAVCYRPIPDEDMQLTVKVNRRPMKSRRKDTNTMYFSGEATMVVVKTHEGKAITFRAMTWAEEAHVSIRLGAVRGAQAEAVDGYELAVQ